MLDSIIIRVHLQSFSTDNEYGNISVKLYKELGGDPTEARLKTRSGMIVAFVDKYWDMLRCAEYNSISIACLLTEWCYVYGKPDKIIQQLQSKLAKTTHGQKLGVTTSGTMDDKTLAALNSQSPAAFFAELKEFRSKWYDALVKNDPSQQAYLNKWLQRLNAIQFGKLTNSKGSVTTFDEDGGHSSIDVASDPYRIRTYSNINILAPFIFSYAGGYTCDEYGNITNRGISLPKWRVDGRDLNRDGKIDEEDLKLVSEDEAFSFLKRNFWDKMQASKIKSQNVANMLVDWAWEAGVKEVSLQMGFTLPDDGTLGYDALNKINGSDSLGMFKDIYALRKDYYNNVVKNDIQKKKFLGIWLKRLEALQFGTLTCKDGTKITFSDCPASIDNSYDTSRQEMNSFVKTLFGQIY